MASCTGHRAAGAVCGGHGAICERERESLWMLHRVDWYKRRPTFRINILPSTLGVMQPKMRLLSPLDPEDDGSTFLRNVGDELSIDTA